MFLLLLLPPGATGDSVIRVHSVLRFGRSKRAKTRSSLSDWSRSSAKQARPRSLLALYQGMISAGLEDGKSAKDTADLSPTRSRQQIPGAPYLAPFLARCGIPLRSTRKHSDLDQHLRSRSVVSHISAKTSEIWGTPDLLPIKWATQEKRATSCLRIGHYT
jgi:hypothetical protein